ncbi:MAG: Holliday junction resolvase Hjc [archaeon]
MGGKIKGAASERELVTMLWGSGWAAVRAAGSGVTKFYCPDVIASNGTRTVAFECKSTKYKYQHLDHQQVVDLEKFAKAFNAKPVVAVKFSTEWKFFGIGDLQKTKNHFSVAYDNAKAKFFSDVLA